MQHMRHMKHMHLLGTCEHLAPNWCSFKQRHLWYLSALLSGITCDTENTKCMQRVCTKCCYDEPNLQDHNPADTATWEQWEKQDVVVGERSYKNWVKLEIWDCKEKAIYRKDTIKDAIENMPPFMVNNIARHKSHHHHLIPWLSLKKI